MTSNKVIAMIMDSVHRDPTCVSSMRRWLSVASQCRGWSEKRRQLLAALRARNVTAATRLMRTHLGCSAAAHAAELDPGAMSRIIALAEDTTGHAPLKRDPE